MKHLRLSLLATTCAIAITACSSNSGPSRYPEQAKKDIDKVSAVQTEVETKLAAKEKELDNKVKEVEALKQKEKELSQKLNEVTNERNALESKEQDLKQQLEISQDQNNELSEKKKELEAQKTELTRQINQLEKEKSELAEELEKAKPIVAQVEKEKKEQEEKLAQEKADKIRIEKNKSEIVKGFANNGLDAEGISYVSGAKFVVEGDKLTYQAVAEQSKKLNELVIDGKKIELFSNETILARQETYENETHNFDAIKAEGLTGKVGSLPKRKIGDDFAQMRFGYVTDKAGKTTLFVQGHQTPTSETVKSPFSYYRAGQEGETEILRALPAEGRWEYQGYAFYGKDNQYKQFGVNAMADIDNKKVKVDIMEGDATKLTFGGAISGNQFTGNYEGIEAKGAFYGTKGQDIGGIFYQTQGVEKDYNGVFGATQRDCGWRGCELPEKSLKDFTLSQ